MKKYIKKLLLIASLCLTIAGVIFLTISFFYNSTNDLFKYIFMLYCPCQSFSGY